MLKNKLISILFVLVGIGLIASGIFSTDPLFGYPEEHPILGKEFTIHGKLHSISALLVFFGLPILCFKTRNLFNSLNKSKWKSYSILTGISMLLLFFLASFAMNNFLGQKLWGGLIQRLCIIIGFLWISFLANHLNTKQNLNQNLS